MNVVWDPSFGGCLYLWTAEVVARSVWDICKKKGDIYLDRYEGW